MAVVSSSFASREIAVLLRQWKRPRYFLAICFSFRGRGSRAHNKDRTAVTELKLVPQFQWHNNKSIWPITSISDAVIALKDSKERGKNKAVIPSTLFRRLGLCRPGLALE